MKTTIGALTMSLAMTASTGALAQTADEAAIATIVESVGTLADRGDFENLERLYADEVRVDYSTLTGEPADLKSASGLMSEWAAVLPGFDRTRHALSNIDVAVNGGTATATADVTATHWISDDIWAARGRYAYALAKEADDWRITAMTFILEDERGSRDVFGPAMAAADIRPPSYIVRQRSQQAVRDFLEGLEDKDMERVNGVWAEDAVQEMPYAPAGFPKRVAGRDALIAHYSGWPQNAGDANFTDSLVFYPTRDPEIVVAEFHGIAEIVPTGRTYDQRYLGIFHVEDGKITLFREHFDPAAFAYAFGMEDGDTSNFSRGE